MDAYCWFQFETGGCGEFGEVKYVAGLLSGSLKMILNLQRFKLEGIYFE